GVAVLVPQVAGAYPLLRAAAAAPAAPRAAPVPPPEPVAQRWRWHAPERAVSPVEGARPRESSVPFGATWRVSHRASQPGPVPHGLWSLAPETRAAAYASLCSASWRPVSSDRLCSLVGGSIPSALAATSSRSPLAHYRRMGAISLCVRFLRNSGLAGALKPGLLKMSPRRSTEIARLARHGE